MSRVFKSLVVMSLTGIVLTAMNSAARGDNRTQPSVEPSVVATGFGPNRVQGPDNIFRVPKRIRSDGSVDVTAALNRFINSLPNNSAVVFAKNGRYRIDGTLEIKEMTGLWLRGRGAKLFARSKGDAFRRHIRVTGGANVVIRDLTVKGANPNAGMADKAFDPQFEFQHGIEFDGVQGALLDHVRIFDVYGDFVYLGASHYSEGVFTPSRNITIQNSRFERNGRMGISVDFASDVLIQDNYMGECRRSWVDVEPTATNWSVDGLTIKNNTVGPHRLNFFANAGRGDNVRNIVITNNRTAPGANFGAITVTRGDSPDAGGGYRGPYLIEGNVGPSRAGFSFREAADVTIRNNTMPFSAGPVVKLNDAHTIRVDGNSFRGATTIFEVNDPTPGLSYDYTESNNTL